MILEAKGSKRGQAVIIDILRVYATEGSPWGQRLNEPLPIKITLEDDASVVPP